MTTYLKPWRITGVARIEAATVEDAELLFLRRSVEDLAPEGVLETDAAVEEGAHERPQEREPPASSGD